MFKLSRFNCLAGAVVLGCTVVSAQATAETGAQAENTAKPHIWASAGWSQLNLPSFDFTLKHQNKNEVGYSNPYNPLQFMGRQTDHDGSMEDGQRYDFGVQGIRLNKGTGPYITGGIKGYYARYSGKSATGCDETATDTNERPGVTCTFIPLSDQFDDPAAYEIGASEVHSGHVNREVHNWGAALETLVKAKQSDSIGLKFGAAYKTIDQSISYNVSGDQGFIAPYLSGTANYNEDLKTDYWGGYIGAVGDMKLGRGLSLVVDAEVGIYYAKTDYNGDYLYNITRVNESSLSLSRDDAAIVGSMKVELKQKVGKLNLSAFALGEFYSYAPRMIYKSNDNRYQGTGRDGAYGDSDKTEILSDEAWGVTVGVRASFPTN